MLDGSSQGSDLDTPALSKSHKRFAEMWLQTRPVDLSQLLGMSRSGFLALKSESKSFDFE